MLVVALAPCDSRNRAHERDFFLFLANLLMFVLHKEKERENENAFDFIATSVENRTARESRAIPWL